jgi:hypothetical protein
MFCLTAILRAFWNKPERSFMPPRNCAVATTLVNEGSEMAVRLITMPATTISSTVENPDC